jgi:Gpi18-like mannosyltransferase
MQFKARFENIKQSVNSLDIEQIGFLFLGTILAILIRISLLDFKSVDYDVYTKVWYNTIQTLGYTAFKGDFSNYNPPYLYLLYLVVRFLPDMAKVAAIKVPSIIADFLCAGFVYKIIRLKNASRMQALFGYMATLLAPVVILNSAFWGQADSIYTTGLVACVYFLLIKRNWLAFVSFAIAFAFKLQAIFLLPLLIILWLKRDVSWKHFLAVPLAYFISILPAWLIGRPLDSLLAVYTSQADQYNRLTMHAPTLYAWFPNDPEIFQLIYPAALALAVTVVLILILIVMKSKAKLTTPLLVELASFTVLLIPFVLPKMHQRYFFSADILLIVFGFYFPAYFYVPLVINMVSFFSYQYFLFGPETFPIGGLAVVTLFIVATLARKLILDLYPQINNGSHENVQALQESD